MRKGGRGFLKNFFIFSPNFSLPSKGLINDIYLLNLILFLIKFKICIEPEIF
jgi:hypothetical protein